MAPGPLVRVRRICLALPEAHEVEAWGEPTFRVRNKLFAMYASASSHHGGGRPAIWCKAGPGNQSLMIQFAPHRFFAPPYVGPSGWVGVWLDGGVNWTELAEVLRDAYLLTAPKRVASALNEPPARPASTSGKAGSAKAGSAKAGSRRRGNVKRGTTKRASTNRSSGKRGTTKRGTTKRGTTKRATPKRSTTKHSSAKRGTGKRGTAKRAR